MCSVMCNVKNTAGLDVHYFIVAATARCVAEASNMCTALAMHPGPDAGDARLQLVMITLFHCAEAMRKRKLLTIPRKVI